MMRQILFVWLAILIALLPVQTFAQDSLTAHTTADDTLNVRRGPGIGYGIAAELAPSTEVIVESRTLARWVYVRTPDDSVSGWVNAFYLVFAEGENVYHAPLYVPDVPARESEAVAASTLNVRQAADFGAEVIAALPAGTRVTLEARDFSGYWGLARTPDGLRGWIALAHVRFDDANPNLPESEEVVPLEQEITGPPVVPDSAPSNVSETAAQDAEAVTYASDIPQAPVVPWIGPAVREIFLKGQALGNRPDTITRVGDCATETEWFLLPVLDDDFDFNGHDDDLLPVVAFFGGSFARPSVAALTSMNAMRLLDPANTPGCRAGETLLACEYRRSKPSIALIMLGTNDIRMSDRFQYEARMRAIVEYSIGQGVIPVLTTIPVQPADEFFWMTVADANHILADLAAEYGVPLWNYARSLDSLPNGGVGKDGAHITPTGYWLRNLTGLMVLKAIKDAAISPE